MSEDSIDKRLTSLEAKYISLEDIAKQSAKNIEDMHKKGVVFHEDLVRLSNHIASLDKHVARLANSVTIGGVLGLAIFGALLALVFKS